MMVKKNVKSVEGLEKKVDRISQKVKWVEREFPYRVIRILGD